MLSQNGDRRHKGRRGVRRWTAVVAAIGCVPTLAAAGCSTPAEPGRDDTSPVTSERARPPVAVRVGEEFRNGSFEMRVTRVRTGLTEYSIGIGDRPDRSRNGQFVLIHLVARNIGLSAAPFGTRRHQMVDTTGRRYAPEDVRGFDYHLPIKPEAATRGIIVFDVAKTAELATVVLQSDDSANGPDASTVVDVWLPHAVPPRYRPAPGRLR
jgi:hypothetical protein